MRLRVEKALEDPGVDTVRCGTLSTDILESKDHVHYKLGWAILVATQCQSLTGK